MDIDGLRDRDHVLAFIAADHASAGERSAGLGLRLALEGGTASVDGKGLLFGIGTAELCIIRRRPSVHFQMLF